MVTKDTASTPSCLADFEHGLQALEVATLQRSNIHRAMFSGYIDAFHPLAVRACVMQ
ncbi:hypothetical protein G6O69_21825 [Pseudenhygromyxa sp. WMMC2535]|uniref:hypothetical protein n=1 Tax=Pseudenhygromyxa sp. WMMC2535 TaxID=2712867 RepID=UPI0015956362|nr:hypothetical protein [Pseudenhygromyxa sp. WMMC2535]NVB40495.1 hypothetical protein [Pseudenhygromyxa sp. WMMC2535]